MLRFGIVVVALVGTIILVAGAILALSGAGIIPGIALIVLGLLVALVGGGLAVALRMWRIAMEWRELLKGGPGAVRLASVQPPRGAIFNR